MSDNTDITKALEAIFTSTDLKFRVSSGSDGRDSLSLTFTGIGKEFIFDAETGKYLGAIEARQERPATPAVRMYGPNPVFGPRLGLGQLLLPPLLEDPPKTASPAISPIESILRGKFGQ